MNKTYPGTWIIQIQIQIQTQVKSKSKSKSKSIPIPIPIPIPITHLILHNLNLLILQTIHKSLPNFSYSHEKNGNRILPSMPNPPNTIAM
ncbi:hypothetical protein EYC84_012029 [Monilinia fructicola]|uniref:Uncharacterized protein n=1 Tax=Monilinia fructicola TaxID=38448 RepID=A0A5M9J4B1_MONFR|nr:hypothetical protein EYC84_012029 [Monilinia fructicola]